MLCPKCEAVRFLPTQATICSDAVSGVNSHVKKAQTSAHRIVLIRHQSSLSPLSAHRRAPLRISLRASIKTKQSLKR